MYFPLLLPLSTFPDRCLYSNSSRDMGLPTCTPLTTTRKTSSSRSVLYGTNTKEKSKTARPRNQSITRPKDKMKNKYTYICVNPNIVLPKEYSSPLSIAIRKRIHDHQATPSFLIPPSRSHVAPDLPVRTSVRMHRPLGWTT